MNEAMAQTIKAHYLEWSGGSPPECDFEIFTYVEAACPFEVEEHELFRLLDDWRRAAENDTFRFVDGKIIREHSRPQQ